MSYGTISRALPGAGADIRILAQAKIKKKKSYSTRAADWKSSLSSGCDSKLNTNRMHAAYDGHARDMEVGLAGCRPRATVATRRNTAECLQMRTLDFPRKLSAERHSAAALCFQVSQFRKVYAYN